MLNVTAVGNLAADPRTNTVGQTEVTNFRLLVNKKIKDEEFLSAIDCAVWGARARIAAEYLTKGSRVTVSGSGHLSEYERKDGSIGCTLVLQVNDFTLPPRPQQAAAAEDNLPF